MTIDPKVAALLAQGATDFSSVESDNPYGPGGEWPPEGEIDAIVTGFRCTPGEFRDDEGRTVPCVEVSFQYSWEKDPASGEHAEFTGYRMQLVPNFNTVIKRDKSKTRARISWEKFKGSISRMLGEPPESINNPVEALNRLQKRLDQDSLLVVRLSIAHRPYSRTDPKTNAVREAIAKEEKVLHRVSDA